MARAPGGVDHVVLGSDKETYDASVMEAMTRIAVRPDVVKSVLESPTAGGRVESSRPAVRLMQPLGGTDHISLGTQRA